MKIIVLGGQGFVGQNVVDALQPSSHTVISLSRRSGLDLTDLEAARQSFEKHQPDVIINCAAHVGSVHYVSDLTADLLEDNMRMNLNLYRAIKDVNPKIKVINPISNCAYPGDALIQKESEFWNGPVHPSVWSFANSKRMLLVTSQCYASQYGIRSVNFLVGGVYGPGDYTDPRRTHALNGMIVRMLKAKQEKKNEFEIWGTGKPSREWIFVKDLAQILIQAIDQPDQQLEPINIAQNKAYTVRETAEIVKELTGFAGPLVFNTKYQDGALIKKLDDTLFKGHYPHKTFTDFRSGIQTTIAYYEIALQKDLAPR